MTARVWAIPAQGALPERICVELLASGPTPNHRTVRWNMWMDRDEAAELREVLQRFLGAQPEGKAS